MTDIRSELLALSEYTFEARIRPRLNGLTDEEYLWEPVDGMWSLRPDREGVFRLDGHRVVRPDRHPFTTLAWRLWHLIGCYGETRNGEWLGVDAIGGEFDHLSPAPATADDALAALDAAYAWWSSSLRSVSEELLHEMIGPVGGPYSESSKAAFVLHQLDEVIHHGAEVALLRDLYRAEIGAGNRQPPATVVEAAAGGYWDDVRWLVQAGYDVNGSCPDDFDRTALHYAAAGAPLDVIAMLVDHGADVSAVDSQFDATPTGWADYFGRPDVAALLSPQATT